MRDPKEVETLLNIAAQARNWPHLQPLHDSAMEALANVTKEEKVRMDKAKEEKAKVEAPPAPPVKPVEPTPSPLFTRPAFAHHSEEK